MKTILTAINSQYVHMNLAVWYLKAACENKGYENILVKEFSINENIDNVLAVLMSLKPDVVCFSCYIWNIGYILKISSCIKKINKNIKIILGGPQVSFCAGKILYENEHIDFIVCGEGEEVLPELLLKVKNNVTCVNLSGVSQRHKNEIYVNEEYQIIENLNDIPSPYTLDMLKCIKQKIIYIESSRGCVFKCSYCLSSILTGVREFPLKRVKDDLDRILSENVKTIKFIDRTFNLNPKRAIKILDYIKNDKSNTRYHFEIRADMLTDMEMDKIACLQKGKVQFEAGIQSFNEKVLENCRRKTNLKKTKENIKKLIKYKNSHIHVDLIAGLPKQSLEDMKNSFNEAYGLKPHYLQLGFLKLLYGTLLKEKEKDYGYIAKDYPPYEVLLSDTLPYEHMNMLKGIEIIADRYYNSLRYMRSLEYLTEPMESYFDFYYLLYMYNLKKGTLYRPVNKKAAFIILYDFAKEHIKDINFDILKEKLRLDWILTERAGGMPNFIRSDFINEKKKIYESITLDENFFNDEFSHFKGQNTAYVKAKSYVDSFKYINDKFIFIDYTQKNNITGHFLYKYFK